MDLTPDRMRAIDNRLLEVLQTVATEENLESDQLLTRVCSVLALLLLTAAPYGVGTQQLLKDLLDTQSEIFLHYARQFAHDATPRLPF